MMKRLGVFVGISTVLLIGLVLALRSNARVTVKIPEPWKTGYWIWAGEAPMPASLKPQILYVQAQGTSWPGNLPDADEYVVVRRIDLQHGQELSRQAASKIAEDYRILAGRVDPGVHITGLQIDYDCPTSKLNTYAGFLGQLRQELPPASRLSITALLDWFGPHTAIAAALAAVDEFVPQFYDAGSERAASGIAEPIDAARWAPIFNAKNTPYRIGISTFGRIARSRHAGGATEVKYFRDASPLDFAGHSELHRSTVTDSAGEVIVHYDGTNYGDSIDITLPTEASVRAAMDAARQFGGNCAGVLFFRWPNRFETLALHPDEVKRILSGQSLGSAVTLETRDASCIERRCSDLTLHLGRTPSPTDRAFEIRARGDMELFLPESPLRLYVRGNQILLTVPAYAGVADIRLGRAISQTPLRFEVSSR